MDAWVLTRETGSYSDYNMDVLAVASTPERAKALADDEVWRGHDRATVSVLEDRAEWPDLSASRLGTHLRSGTCGNRGCDTCSWYRKTGEEAFPLPVLPVLEWKALDGGSEWRAELGGYDDVVYTVFCTPVDRLRDE